MRADPEVLRRIQERANELETRRRKREPLWREIAHYFLPTAGRWTLDEREGKLPEYHQVVDETQFAALDIYAAGMMALRTSPAREWFRLQPSDLQLAKQHDVRVWMHETSQIVHQVFRVSNTYQTLPKLYAENAAFGTAASVMMPDFDTMLHHHHLTIGEYSIGSDARGHVDTIIRKFLLTVGELVGEFGIENVSDRVADAYRMGRYDGTVEVWHAITPRRDRDPTSNAARNMPWRSCYFEAGVQDRYLHESGFRRFPALVPRYDTTSGNVWGDGLGQKVLGSARQLQFQTMAMAKAMHHQSDPPTQVPVDLRDRDLDLLPGGTSYYNQTTPGGGIRTAFEVPLRLDWMQLSLQEVQRRINQLMHVGLFQTLATIESSTQRTALEVMQRREEAMTILGPVTQRAQNELDKPLIDFALDRLIETNALPPLPEALHGQEIEVEFIGPLAQALKAVSAQGVDRFVASLGVVAQMKPDVLDKFDADEWVDHYSDLFGVDPSMVVGGEQVAMIRKSRADAMAAKEQSALIAEQAVAMRNMAAARMDVPSALTEANSLVSGYGQPQAAAV